MKKSSACVDHGSSAAVRALLAGIVTLGLCSVCPAAERPPEYRVIQIGTLGGPPETQVYGVNALGQATGETRTITNESDAFLFSHGSTLDLGALAGMGSIGWAINDAGQVTGTSTVSALVGPKQKHPYHAFLYTNGQMTDIGTLGGDYSLGNAINSHGEVAGQAYFPGNIVSHAFLYRNGQMMDVGTLGGTHSLAWGINSRGAVVGESTLLGDASDHAFIYADGSIEDLGALSNGYSRAFAVNCAGQVTGDSANRNGEQHAVLYEHGHIKDLGTLPGDIASVGYSINSAGDIVGASGPNLVPNGHAFIYTDGRMFDLLTLISSSDPLLPFTLYEARAISDSGVIAVNGMDADGNLLAYLLEPRERRHGEGEKSKGAHGRDCLADDKDDGHKEK